MFFKFIDILKIITIFQLFFISIFLFLNSTRKSKKNYLLVLFVLSKALFLIDTLFITYYESIFAINPNLAAVGSSFQFIIGPAVYYMIIETVHHDVIFKPKHLLHLLPFVLHLTFMIFNFHVLSTETKLDLVENGFPYSMPWARIFGTINYIQFAVYAAFALKALIRGRESVKKVSSQYLDKSIFFLEFIIYDYAIVWGINTISMFLPVGRDWWSVLGPITVLNIFFVANAIVYQGLKFPQIFKDETSDRQKYEKNLLTDNEKEYYAGKLKEYMNTHKPFLKPTLSLADLAEDLAVPPHILSQTLNTMLKQNFYDFVNNYRIEESKRLLSSNDDDKTILQVLYQSGFNSKSVFNTAFRKYTGMTPSEFKRRVPDFSLSN